MNQALSRPAASVEMQAYLLGLMSVAAFALTLPCAKVLAGPLSAMQIGLFRSMLAALAALPILWFTRSARPNASQVKRLLLLSLGIVYGFPILTAVGMRYVPVGHGGVVLAALPLATAIFGSLITKDRPPLLFWLASIGGFVAVALFAAWRCLRRGAVVSAVVFTSATWRYWAQWRWPVLAMPRAAPCPKRCRDGK